MSTIAVTGVSGVLGQRLLLRLAADRSVERVVGIDARDSAVMPAKLDFHRADIGTAELKSLLHGVDAARRAGTRPPMQFVHADDVAAAIHLALTERLDGVYNVAPDGWIAGEEARALAGGRRLSLPIGVIGRFDRAVAQSRPWLEQSWVVGNDRLRAAGWTPTHTNEEALVAGAPPSPWQALNAKRRQALALGGAVAGVAGLTAGSIALVRAARRRAAEHRTAGDA